VLDRERDVGLGEDEEGVAPLEGRVLRHAQHVVAQRLDLQVAVALGAGREHAHVGVVARHDAQTHRAAATALAGGGGAEHGLGQAEGGALLPHAGGAVEQVGVREMTAFDGAPQHEQGGVLAA